MDEGTEGPRTHDASLSSGSSTVSILVTSCLAIKVVTLGHSRGDRRPLTTWKTTEVGPTTCSRGGVFTTRVYEGVVDGLLSAFTRRTRQNTMTGNVVFLDTSTCVSPFPAVFVASGSSPSTVAFASDQGSVSPPTIAACTPNLPSKKAS